MSCCLMEPVGGECVFVLRSHENHAGKMFGDSGKKKSGLSNGGTLKSYENQIVVSSFYSEKSQSLVLFARNFILQRNS